MIRERLRHGLPGIPILIAAFLALAGIVWLFFSGVAPDGDGGDGPGSVPGLERMVADLVSLARRARDAGERLYCWTRSAW